MTKVCIVGDMYYTDLSIGGGPIIPPGGGGGAPGYPAHPWVPPWGPAHPIAPGGQPPGFWGGVAPPWVDTTPPGPQPGPSHPWIPPRPGQGQPPGIWGGANEPFPTPPIFIPPNAPPVDPPTDESKVVWKSGWTADKGWITVGIFQPEAPIPTPSS
jgi:hypothetical protein